VTAGVLVNECLVFAVGKASAWWAEYLIRNRDRVIELVHSVGGAVCWVPCDDLDHATWLAGLMRTRGLPEKSVYACYTRRGVVPASAFRVVGAAKGAQDHPLPPPRRKGVVS
jgi:hypothetical protein